MKTIDTLITDVEKLFDGHSIEEGAAKFADKLGAVFVDRFSKYAEERKPDLYLSNIGKPLRQLWYQLKGYKGEALSPSARLKFLFGDVIEELLLFLAAESGHTVEKLQHNVEIDGVRGRIDCTIDGVLVDVKSCSTYSFQKFKDGSIIENDPFGYMMQLASYSQALGGLDAAFWALDKTLGNMCLCRFTGEQLSKYDIKTRISDVRQSLEVDTPPERCYQPIPISSKDKSGNLKLPVGCSYCSYKYLCHSDANDGAGLQVAYYSSGPVYLTTVKKQPRVQTSFDEFPIKD